MRKIIVNARIITVNKGNDIIDNGHILIKGDEILKAGPGEISENEKNEADEIFDAQKMIVMPGFVNTHTHIPMSIFKGYADDLPLRQWLNSRIFPAEAKWITPHNTAIATKWALCEMIKSGTTTFNDMYFFSDIIAEECAKTGLRGVLNESLSDFPCPGFKTADEAVERIRRNILRYEGHPLISASVPAHAPYSCSRETLLKGKKTADKYGCLFHIHLSETEAENSASVEKTGMTPTAYLHSIGILDKNTVAAHCVYLSPEDMEIFANTSASAVHCPKSNLKLGSGMADIKKYGDAGINVALGTDGSASNNNLNMVEEMRFASLMAKGIHRDPTVMTAIESIRMATLNGAHALGLGEITGSIERGKKADLIFINPEENMAPVYAPASSVVYAMEARNIIHSMVNGKWVMKNRNIEKIDYPEVLKEIEYIRGKIKNDI